MGNNKSKVIWYWKSNTNPWNKDEPGTWTQYSDIESDVIEDAYQHAKPSVLLDNYLIDVVRSVQIYREDQTKQRPIKRVAHSESQPRQERFSIIDPKPVTFSENTNDIAHPLLAKISASRVSSLQQGKFCLRVAASQIICGIIEEGQKLNKNIEAQWIADQITKAAATENERAFFRVLIALYTKECFLYKILNQALRENKQEKTDTLGTYCVFLNSYIRGRTLGYDYEFSEDNFGSNCVLDLSWGNPRKDLQARMKKLDIEGHRYFKRVYRGAQLTATMLNCYQERLSQSHSLFKWDSFTSTTKSKKIADNFGNTLFIIDLTDSPGLDISDISYHQDEEEVLLSASSLFIIERIVRSESKHKIFLKKVDLAKPKKNIIYRLPQTGIYLTRNQLLKNTEAHVFIEGDHYKDIPRFR